MNTMGDYHNLYLKTGVLLLVDVSEKFITMCLDYYGLNPSPGLSWDAMVKMTRIELELISDIDVHLFIEKRMRGGISYIAKRYSKANSQCTKCYDSSKENIYITYDANNLYGQAMSQYLPYNGFNWLNQKEISGFCLHSVSENSLIGYILEVDLEYPSELHDSYNDYPLAPKNLKLVNRYCQNIVLILQINMESKLVKLGT